MSSVIGTGSSQPTGTGSSPTFESVDVNYTDYCQTTTPANPASGKDRIYSKADDKLYLLTAAGVESAISGGGLTTSWDFSTTLTMADPGSGIMRFDNATTASVTEVAISTDNSSGNSSRPLLASLQMGDSILFGDLDGSNTKLYNISSVVDNTTWFSLTVALESESEVGNYADGEEILTTLYPSANPFDQSLNTTDSPTFVAVTAPTVTATAIYESDVNDNYIWTDVPITTFTTAFNNIAIGRSTLQSNITGAYNICVGGSAGQNLTSAECCVYIGDNTGTDNNGNFNVFCGANCFNEIGSGTHNSGLGEGVLDSVSSGISNCGVGSFAGNLVTTGSSNIFLGRSSNTSLGTGSYRIALGDTAIADADNTCVIGSVTSGQSIEVIKPGVDAECDLGTPTKQFNNLYLGNSMQLNHTSTEDDDHALEIIHDAAGFLDTKAFDIVYATGAQPALSEEEAILINIDNSAAVGGETVGVAMVCVGGASECYGLEVGATINPIIQVAGAFADPSTGNIDNNGSTVAVGSLSGVDLFVADDDYIIIADATTFEEIAFTLDVASSGSGIRPLFQYSTGTGPLAWTTFGPTDGTNGFRNTGALLWLAADVTGWVADGGVYKVRIQRRRNSLTTVPRLINSGVEVAAGVTEYGWDKNGDVTINDLTVANINGSPVAAGIVTDLGTAGSYALTNLVGGSPTGITGVNNLLVGDKAGGALTSGAYNIVIGNRVVDAGLSTADGCIYIGDLSGNNINADGQIAIGDRAMSGAASSTAADCIAIGRQALYVTSASSGCIAIGDQALSAATTSSRCVGIGFESLDDLTVSGDCASVGYQSGKFNTGSDNTFIGSYSGLGVTATSVGNSHTAIGSRSLEKTTSGTACTAIGKSALRANTTGDYNCAVGNSALLNLTTGDRNVGIGFNCGSTLGVGGNNVLLGDGADTVASGIDNSVALGSGAIATSDNQFKIGSVSTPITDVIPAVSGSTSLGSTAFHFDDTFARRSFIYNNAGTDYVGMTVPTSPTSWVMTLPPTNGNEGERLQTDGAGITTWVKPDRIRAYAQTVQNIADATYVKLTMGGLLGTSQGITLAANDLIIGTTGTYHITFKITFSNDPSVQTASTRQAFITNNVTTTPATTDARFGHCGYDQDDTTSLLCALNGSDVLELTAGDKLQLWAWHNSGGSTLTVPAVADVARRTYFTAMRVA